ncbi:heme-degrading monooxygenase HmoA [Afipia massiliensis]|uniref:Heme-degrading monooxygenase HmoA n=1 Tax=Afipia massiliensis TaxID=211460 RepID=A0A840N534_9BRAD|nr:antibiotic biosynthesis monooxygenase [Afipia massiliensis]MBB5055163.1 heme-degrading monooxygenase HmoA [Afipia massiliensis]
MIVTVFRTRLAPDILDEYGPKANEMSELVQSIPGHISHKGFVAEDGERVTIVEFESEKALHEWKVHAGHVEAKKLGFAKFYSSFKYQICNVTHTRSWERKAGKS